MNMFSEVTTVIFFASLGVIIFLLVLRLLEKHFGFNTFGRFDFFVQVLVTRTSAITLWYSMRIKRFLLVRVYHVSSETARSLLKRSREQRESLLNTLGGMSPRTQEKNGDENVSPFLKEISRVDRKEE